MTTCKRYSHSQTCIQHFFVINKEIFPYMYISFLSQYTPYAFDTPALIFSLSQYLSHCHHPIISEDSALYQQKIVSE